MCCFVLSTNAQEWSSHRMRHSNSKSQHPPRSLTAHERVSIFLRHPSSLPVYVYVHAWKPKGLPIQDLFRINNFTLLVGLICVNRLAKIRHLKGRCQPSCTCSLASKLHETHTIFFFCFCSDHFALLPRSLLFFESPLSSVFLHFSPSLSVLLSVKT